MSIGRKHSFTVIDGGICLPTVIDSAAVEVLQNDTMEFEIDLPLDRIRESQRLRKLAEDESERINAKARAQRKKSMLIKKRLAQQDRDRARLRRNLKRWTVGLVSVSIITFISYFVSSYLIDFLNNKLSLIPTFDTSGWIKSIYFVFLVAIAPILSLMIIVARKRESRVFTFTRQVIFIDSGAILFLVLLSSLNFLKSLVIG